MTYVTTVLGDSPAHYWRLADPGGFLAHDIGAGPFHLDANPASQWNGYSGIAADGGSSAFISGIEAWSGGDSLLITAPLSIELWVWPLSFRGGATQDLFRWDNSSNPFANIQLLSNGTFRSNLANVSSTSVTVYPLQHWHHVVGTYSVVNGNRLYVDGTIQATQASASAFPTSAVIHIGIDTGNLCGCWMTEVATYNKELTAGEVSSHFSAQELTGPPTYQLPGSGISNGGFSGFAQSIDSILADVQKTYVNAP